MDIKIKVSAGPRRCIQHQHARLRSGAGPHKTKQREGPTVEEWDYEEEECESQ